MTSGVVYWFTGLSGAGKTTIGRLFYERIKASGRSAVFLDGDDLREVIADDLSYDVAGRKRSAMRNAKLCKLLSDQGLDVVCSTVSLWHDCQRWNRQNIGHYKEIYLRAPLRTLFARDPKGLYAQATQGKIKNVWGVDIPAEEPESPAVILDNDGSKTPEEIVRELFETLLPTA